MESTGGITRLAATPRSDADGALTVTSTVRSLRIECHPHSAFSGALHDRIRHYTSLDNRLRFKRRTIRPSSRYNR
jgi:hypothetical protein